MKLWERLIGRHEILGAKFNGAALYTTGDLWGEGDERTLNDFADYVRSGYYDNGIVFACIAARGLMLGEVEFKYQRLSSRELFGDPSLSKLERPWTNGTTGELVARADQDVSLAGNFYGRIYADGIERLRPDWVAIVSMKDGRGRRRVVGYAYQEGGPESGNDPELILAEDVVHWSPIPDPLAPFRGMSWLTPVAREIVGDSAMQRHKLKFFDQAATPNLLISVKESLTPEQKTDFRTQLEQRHAGIDAAYKTLVLDAGADAEVIGNSFEQMSFATVQAAGENRIVMASGVAAIVVGAKEGLQASTYSNFQQAMRKTSDVFCRPSWRSMCAAFQPAVSVPDGSRLWYDDRHIPFLAQDGKDDADIKASNAQTVRQLTEAGYTPESIKQYVVSGDPMVLEHTGVFSVQLQPPGSGQDDAA